MESMDNLKGITESTDNFNIENRHLKEQIEALNLELKDKESKLVLSGKLGNELLQSNTELHRNLEEIQESNLKDMEV